MFTTAAKSDLEHYNTKVWPVVGIALKLGTLEDSKNQAKLVKLLRFESTSSTGQSLSLDDYVAKRRKGQTQIYFIAGAGMDKKDLARSPFVETIQARGYEVSRIEALHRKSPTIVSGSVLHSKASHSVDRRC